VRQASSTCSPARPDACTTSDRPLSRYELCGDARESRTAARPFIRKWRLKWSSGCRKPRRSCDSPLALSRACLRASGESARTTNAIDRLHEEFKRRIQTRPCCRRPDHAAMLFWALSLWSNQHAQVVSWHTSPAHTNKAINRLNLALLFTLEMPARVNKFPNTIRDAPVSYSHFGLMSVRQ